MDKEELLTRLRLTKIKTLGIIDELLEIGHTIDSTVEEIERD